MFVVLVIFFLFVVLVIFFHIHILLVVIFANGFRIVLATILILNQGRIDLGVKRWFSSSVSTSFFDLWLLLLCICLCVTLPLEASPRTKSRLTEERNRNVIIAIQSKELTHLTLLK